MATFVINTTISIMEVIKVMKLHLIVRLRPLFDV